MARIPDSNQGTIDYLQSKMTPWGDNAVAIGTTAARVTAMGTLITQAQDAMAAQVAAAQASKNATTACNNAIMALHQAGAEILKQIDTQAGITGPSVWTLAVVDPPAPPSPVGKPGLPYKLVATLKPNGSIELTFKCSNPKNCNGVIYQVYRKVEVLDDYAYLGGTGERKFIDLSAPRGVPSIMYQIQGTRSTSVGDAAEFIVNLGISSGATVNATVVDATPKPAKIAA
jgi:hypothetical protein